MNLKVWVGQMGTGKSCREKDQLQSYCSNSGLRVCPGILGENISETYTGRNCKTVTLWMRERKRERKR